MFKKRECQCDLFLIAGVSFNLPKLCPTATWNSYASTFANSSTIGAFETGIFINTLNTVYILNGQSGAVQIWVEGSGDPTNTIPSTSSYVYSLFVTNAGDIYLNNHYATSRLEMWRENVGSFLSTLYIGSTCNSLFIDTNQSLYCSVQNSHKIVKRSMNSSDFQVTTVTGGDCPGYLADKLYYPSGIFVSLSFDLYVADSKNNRIQRFRPGQGNGTTVAGSGAPLTYNLDNPTGVVLDADGYLFIVDCNPHRIIGSSPDGFRCVIGCFTNYGSASDQLANPSRMAFDSYGNIFVTDTSNQRVQKFLLTMNTCSKLKVRAHARSAAEESFGTLSRIRDRIERNAEFSCRWIQWNNYRTIKRNSNLTTRYE